MRPGSFRMLRKPLFGLTCVLVFATGSSAQFAIEDDARALTISTQHYIMRVEKQGFRFSLPGLLAHASHGLEFGGSPVSSARLASSDSDSVRIAIENRAGKRGVVLIRPHDFYVSLEIVAGGTDFAVQTSGASPAYGLADTAGYLSTANLEQAGKLQCVNTGGRKRFISSFVIFPKARAAGVVFVRASETVTLQAGTYRMSWQHGGKARVYYFTGEPKRIYADYQAVRAAEGYPDPRPQFSLFELGYEAWDAMRWNENERDARPILQQFLDGDYPIRWITLFMGEEKGGTETSFGRWDYKRYPDPNGFKQWLHERKIQWLIGTQINFVALGGPYRESGTETCNPREGRLLESGPFSAEGIEKGFFFKNPDATLYTKASPVEPQVPCHLVDGHVHGAAQWFRDLFARWGADGFKEDTMIDVPDASIFNNIVKALTDAGYLAMARNGKYTMPGTLARVDDIFTIDAMTDRVPVNFLQYAACAAPNVYADSIGFGGVDTNPVGTIRMAWQNALSAGIAMGRGPWKWPLQQQRMLKKAVDFHYAIAPYLYSAALDAYRTGYPYTMTPLPIAYPDDPNTYEMASYRNQQFEWLAGPSLLAAPLLRRDYRTSNRMRVYLPAGKWIGYENGKTYMGPVTLDAFEVPLDAVPAFVGGKGVLVQRTRDDLPLRAVIYPIATGGSTYIFHYSDGRADTTFVNANDGWDPSTLILTDSGTGLQMPFEHDTKTGAIRFTPAPGHAYRLTGGG